MCSAPIVISRLRVVLRRVETSGARSPDGGRRVNVPLYGIRDVRLRRGRQRLSSCLGACACRLQTGSRCRCSRQFESGGRGASWSPHRGVAWTCWSTRRVRPASGDGAWRHVCVCGGVSRTSFMAFLPNLSGYTMANDNWHRGRRAYGGKVSRGPRLLVSSGVPRYVRS